tara:strand:- start:2024 stop:2824 length:801 start_codon:yes stop_codon:yes gene_type:complete
MISKTHVILDIKSDLRTSGTNDNPAFHFYKNIDFKLSNVKEYYMKIHNIQLPVSFYQINSNYNTLMIKERNAGDTIINIITITIPEGNYTITELTSEIETLLNTNTVQGNTYSVSQDDKTGKINISYTGGSANIDLLSYNGGSTINPIIGGGEYNSLVTTVDIIPAGKDLNNHYNLNFISYVSLETNIVSHNHLDVNSIRNVGSRIPITETRGDVVNVTNNDGYLVRIKQNSISEIQFKLIDPYKNQIELNGTPFSCQLVFYEKDY